MSTNTQAVVLKMTPSENSFTDLIDWDVVEIEERNGGTCYHVNVDAHIKHVKSGEVRVYKTKEYIFEADGDDVYIPCVFNWEENNYSCDCNRYIFFERANGNEPDDFECTDGRYLVNLVNPLYGNVYYREFT